MGEKYATTNLSKLTSYTIPYQASNLLLYFKFAA